MYFAILLTREAVDRCGQPFYIHIDKEFLTSMIKIKNSNVHQMVSLARLSYFIPLDQTQDSRNHKALGNQIRIVNRYSSTVCCSLPKNAARWGELQPGSLVSSTSAIAAASRPEDSNLDERVRPAERIDQPSQHFDWWKPHTVDVREPQDSAIVCEWAAATNPKAVEHDQDVWKQVPGRCRQRGGYGPVVHHLEKERHLRREKTKHFQAMRGQRFYSVFEAIDDLQAWQATSHEELWWTWYLDRRIKPSEYGRTTTLGPG